MLTKVVFHALVFVLFKLSICEWVDVQCFAHAQTLQGRLLLLLRGASRPTVQIDVNYKHVWGGIPPTYKHRKSCSSNSNNNQCCVGGASPFTDGLDLEHKKFKLACVRPFVASNQPSNLSLTLRVPVCLKF